MNKDNLRFEKIKRINKGIDLFKTNVVYKIEDIENYEVLSNNKVYNVTYYKNEDLYVCNCKDFIHRGFKLDCKHIIAVILYKKTL